MTISSTTRKAGPFSGTGAQTAFPFSFKVFTASDLLVVQTDASGVENELTLNTHYSVALNANQDTNPGGTVNLTIALPTGNVLAIGSVIPLTQTTSIPNMGGFYPKVIEQALDKLTIAAQQTAELVGRCLRFPFSDGSPQGDLPAAAARAGKFFAFDGAGNPTAASGTGADVGLRTDLASWLSGSSLIGFIQAGVGAIAQTVQDMLRERVSINSFLSTPGVITQAEFDNAAARALAVDGILRLAGSYSFASLNIAKENLKISCGPSTVFTHTGAGQALLIDGGGVDGSGNGIGQGLFNFELRGKPLIKGNAATTDGVFIRAMQHSKITARAKDCVTAFRINFGVCTEYDLTCSVNQGGFAITPSAGLVTDLRGPGEYVQDCWFKVRMEGVNGTGVEFNNTIGCEIKGTSEGNAVGVAQTSNCDGNRFVGMDLESNTVRDLQDYGTNAHYDHCRALSLCSGNNAEMITSRAAKFSGGFWRTVNMQDTSVGTLFDNVSTSDNASLGLQGPGSYKTINCRKVDTTGAITSWIPDQLGDRGTWTPGFASAAGGSQGAGTAVGTYFRIGKLCYVQGFMSIAKGTLAEGAVSITGLPFASRNTTNDYQYIQMAEWDNVALGAGENGLVMRIAPNSTVGTLLQSGTSVPSANVNVSAFPDPMGLRFSGVYEID